MIKARYLLVYGLLVFAIVFTVFAPATIVPRDADFPKGVTYSSLEGTLWKMTFKGAHVRSRPIGDVTVSLYPLSVLFGTAQGAFEIDHDNLNGSGTVSVDNLITMESFEFSTQTPFNFGTARVLAHVILEGERIEWDRNGQCVSAQGKLVTNGPALLLEGFQKNFPDTVANISCNDGDVQVTFEQDIGVAHLSGSGVFIGSTMLDIELFLRFPDQAAIPATAADFLRQVGFKQKQDGWYSEVTLQL